MLGAWCTARRETFSCGGVAIIRLCNGAKPTPLSSSKRPCVAASYVPGCAARGDKKKAVAAQATCPGCVIPHNGQYYLVPAKAHPYDAVLRDCFGKLKAERDFNLVRGLGWQWDLRGESSCLEGDADGDADDDWDRCPAFGSWA